MGLDVPGIENRPEFRALGRGLWATEVNESVAVMNRFIRLFTAQPLPVADHFMMLGYNLQVPPEVRWGMIFRRIEHDDLLRGLRLPVLLSHGEEDAIVPVEMSRRHAELLQKATLSEYVGVGHMPFWEAPERFNSELREFARKVGAAG
jgi:pimeloyl-ACP methyl ester carboxylesterase